MQIRHVPILATLAAFVVALACGTDARTPGGEAGASAAAGAADPAASHDIAFLREMADHHEGLVRMATTAMSAAATDAARGDAHMLHMKQAAERDSMVAMLRTSFGTEHQPQVTPDGKAMMDSVQARSGPAYDREFYRQTIRHHEQGIRMIDMHLPHLTDARVRTMAERMKGDMKKEIEEFQGKAT